jgi:di- and tripeptidase
LEQKLDTRCIHTITQEDNNSVLSLAANEKYIFSGSQGSKIHVNTLDSCNMYILLINLYFSGMGS